MASTCSAADALLYSLAVLRFLPEAVVRKPARLRIVGLRLVTVDVMKDCRSRAAWSPVTPNIWAVAENRDAIETWPPSVLMPCRVMPTWPLTSAWT